MTETYSFSDSTCDAKRLMQGISLPALPSKVEHDEGRSEYVFGRFDRGLEQLNGVTIDVHAESESDSLREALKLTEIGANTDREAKPRHKVAPEHATDDAERPLPFIERVIAVFIAEIGIIPTQDGAPGNMEIRPEVVFDERPEKSPFESDKDGHLEQVGALAGHVTIAEPIEKTDLALIFCCRETDLKCGCLVITKQFTHITTETEARVGQQNLHAEPMGRFLRSGLAKRL